MPTIPGGHSGREDHDMNRASLLRLGFFLSIALLISSTLPPALLVASFCSLLWIGSLVSALVAAILAEPVLRMPHLTRWDEAAVLMALSLLLSFFVDQQAVMQQVETLRR